MTYQYKKQLTIDHTKVSADLTNFPVLISFTDVDLRTVANGGLVQNANGYDLIFMDGTETTQLDHEIESYTASSGAVVMWMRVPSISSSVDTIIYIYFDDPSVTTSQENAAGVWDSNFKGVYHLESSAADSTGNANNGTNNNVTFSSGEIANGGAFDGATSYIQINGLITSPSTSTTIEGWGRYTGGGQGELISIGDDDTIRVAGGGTQAFFYSGPPLGWTTITSGGDNTVWNHFAYVIDGIGQTQTLFINGSQVDQSTVADPIRYSDNGTNTLIGRHGNGGGVFFQGDIDEVRISDAARSASWIATEYNNQSSPGTFYSVGATSPTTTTSMRTIPSTAALLLTSTRTIPSTAALLQTSTRTVLSTAALQATEQRAITSTAALLLTRTRTIACTAALSETAPPETNATFYVRGGDATFYARDGSATFYIR